MTILLGLVSEQRQDTRTVQGDVRAIREQIVDMKRDNAEFYIRFDRVDRQFNEVDQRLTGIEQGIQQVLQQFAVLAARLDQNK